MSYLNFHDPDFLLKVVDCYYKKSYLVKKENRDDKKKDFEDQLREFWNSMNK